MNLVWTIRRKLSKIHQKYSLAGNAVLACRKAQPRKLKNRYVLMRNGAGEHERETGKKTAIPITVR